MEQENNPTPSSQDEQRIEPAPEHPQEQENVSVPEKPTITVRAYFKADPFGLDSSTVRGTDPQAFVSKELLRLESKIEQKDFKDFWFFGLELKRQLFQLRGLTKDERAHFKNQLEELFQRAKILEDQNKNIVAQVSELKLQRVQQMVDQILAQHADAQQIDLALAELDKVSAFIREGTVTLPSGVTMADMVPMQRDKAKELVRKAREQLLHIRQQIREQNFQKLSEKISALSDFLTKTNKIQQVVKGLQEFRLELRTANLERGHFQELKMIYETLWKKARESQIASREDELHRRVRGMLRLVQRKQQFIEVLQREMKDLEARWANVKNDFFRIHIKELMAEKKMKVEQAEKDVISLNEKIAFLNEQLKTLKTTTQPQVKPQPDTEPPPGIEPGTC
ncbi:MAG: hypothetical protein NZL95_09800 [Chitinophagales bacterium]|nr:hypothetical protein [Chitinophagales bacterium]MDW8428824.1 hypothetical protein [Chitinophagales bacterium]